MVKKHKKCKKWKNAFNAKIHLLQGSTLPILVLLRPSEFLSTFGKAPYWFLTFHQSLQSDCMFLAQGTKVQCKLHAVSTWFPLVITRQLLSLSEAKLEHCEKVICLSLSYRTMSGGLPTHVSPHPFRSASQWLRALPRASPNWSSITLL
jgi:hypothetical protein